MDMQSVTPQMLADTIGADTTLISRWRTGTRKLIPGRHWIERIIEFALERDQSSGKPILAQTMTLFYPNDELDTTDDLKHILATWLTDKKQMSDSYQAKREKLLRLFVAPVNKPSAPEKTKPKHLLFNGEKHLYDAIFSFLDKAGDLEKAAEINCWCPEGLSFLKPTEAGFTELEDNLDRLFKRGYRLNLLLNPNRADTANLSASADQWLSAHLLGHLQGFYTESTPPAGIIATAVIGDKLSLQIRADEKRTYKAELLYYDPAIQELAALVSQAQKQAQACFQTDYFHNPQGLLPVAQGDAYLFSRLPHFSLVDADWADALQLKESEIDYLRREFGLLLNSPEALGPDAQRYQVFCLDDITTILEENQHRVPELENILGHKVYLSTQNLVNQLFALQQLLLNQEKKKEFYHVCFMPERFFDQLLLQIAAGENTGALGFISGGPAFACRDSANMATLLAGCALIWNRIPSVMRSKDAALKKLTFWMRKAKKAGYIIPTAPKPVK
jgi:hypothetical protein